MIDFHPIAVHFPIALLTLYAMLQCMPPKITWRSNPLFLLNSFLVIVGSASLLVARQLGDQLEDTHRDVAHLVHVHSAWATYATALYGIITIIYFLLIVKKLDEDRAMPRVLHVLAGTVSPVTRIAKFLFDYYVVTLLAIMGFILMMVTGALGGAIVYGATADPFVSFVYSWLVQ
ncbi:MAG: hypothetical protein K8Q97_00955 [Candidatus Andersenbacteria bacterium]|nr:hypothetical protein [Candidatus Andersenbacteria bacterium]